MSQTLFYILLIFSVILRTILAPVLIVLKNLFPFLSHRLDFERRNIFEDACQSFKKINKKAQLLFHVSSEGELEQVRPLLEEFLSEGLLIELIFTSDSVEAKCQKIFREHPLQIRILRLPIASFFPISFLYFQSIWGWATASTVVMCRYDFFPELLSFKLFKKRLILVSTATKKMNFFKKLAINSFDFLIAANRFELIELEKNFAVQEMDWFDFRIPRIFSRKNNLNQTINQNNHLRNFYQELKKKDSQSILIIGSMWESDLAIFNDPNLVKKVSQKELTLLIAPHKLSPEFVSNLKDKLSKIFENASLNLFDGSKPYTNCNVVILTFPGVLCEMYTLGNVVYVGGGYEKSIHSVLEPYLMGTKVIVGPKINRSTEYDFINLSNSSEINVLKSPESFYTEFSHLNETLGNQTIRDEIETNMTNRYQKIIARIYLKNVK